MWMTVFSHRFILQTLSMAWRIHIFYGRIHKKYAFIHIPLSINCGGFIFFNGGFINKSALFMSSRWMPHFQKRIRPIFYWIRHHNTWIRHHNIWMRLIFSDGFIFFNGGFINKSALFMYSRWMPHFQKRMRPIFNWIRHFYNESATKIVRDSYSTVADSLIKAPYSFFLDECHIFKNECAPFLAESAMFLMNPPLFSQKRVGYLF